MSHEHEWVGVYSRYCKDAPDCDETPESAIATLTAERDKLLADIKERDRTYLAVQKAEGLEREKVELERDALRTALEALRARMQAPGMPIIQWDATHWIDYISEALGGKS